MEGQLEFRAILFIPKRAPFDLFEPNKKRKNIKLYVKRVFITDDAEELIPDYLNFVKGVVDSEDLPLNISRETLQQNKAMRSIKKALTKKVIEMLVDLQEDKDDYKKFYEIFGKNLKLGCYSETRDRKKIVELLRYYSSKSEDEYTSLKDYVTRMKEGQKGIYYIAGESIEQIKSSPFIEKLVKKDIEVLYMTEPIDEYSIPQIKSYDGKDFINVSKEGLEVDDDEKDEMEKHQELFKEFLEYIKTVLKDDIEKAIISPKLINSPCALSSGEMGWTANMERIMKAQALRDNMMSSYMKAKKIMEINPKHPIIKELFKTFEKDKEDKSLKDMITLLHDSAVLYSGFTLKEPVNFSRRIHNMISIGLGIKNKEEEIEEEIKKDEKKEEKEEKEEKKEEDEFSDDSVEDVD